MAAETSPPNDGAAVAEAAHGHAVPAGTSEVAAEHGGLPQFRFEYWGGQIVWLVLIFAVLYALLAKVFVPRLRNIFDIRAKTIAQAVEQARRVQDEAQTQAQTIQNEIDQARVNARQVASDAKAKVAAKVAKAQAVENERLEGQLAEAEARIRDLRDRAMSNVGDIAETTARAMVEKLTGRPMVAKDVKASAKTTAVGVA